MALYQMGLGLMVMVVVVSALGYLHPKIVHLHFCNLRCSYVQDGCKYIDLTQIPLFRHAAFGPLPGYL